VFTVAYARALVNQLAPIVVEISPDQPISERLVRTQWTALRAYRLGMYDVDRVHPAALGFWCARSTPRCCRPN